ncbi:MAG: hypothetical protein ACE14M_07840 [Terriglobales bacterium]
MSSELTGRAAIERYAPLAKGVQTMMIGDGEYDIPALLVRLDLALDDVRTFDMIKVNENYFVLRYYDGQDQRVVAHEFDASFNFIVEYRAHISAWIGEDAYFDSMKGVPFRCPLVPGEDF